MERRTCLAAVGATFAGVGLAGCSGESNGEDDDDETDSDDDETDSDDEFDWENLEAEVGDTPDSVELVNSFLGETQSGAAVIGIIRNTGDEPYSVLEVEVTLNDGDTVIDEWVDTTEEEINDLDAGESWRFVAEFENENVYEATGYTININADVEDAEGDGTENSS